MSIRTYKRAQITWSLWGLFTGTRPDADLDKIPSVFHTRIKRLLEADRGKADMPDRADLAFGEVAPVGSGVDVPFTAADAFRLALALDMLDLGLKVADAVFFIQHTRELLDAEYDYILTRPPRRGRVSARSAPDRPSVERAGLKLADLRSYLVVRPVSIQESTPTLKQKKAYRGMPIFVEPMICRGIAALNEFMDSRARMGRKAMVFELAHTAATVTHNLEEAPEFRRGRE